MFILLSKRWCKLDEIYKDKNNIGCILADEIGLGENLTDDKSSYSARTIRKAFLDCGSSIINSKLE